jgi:NADH-quinone oxidoreductase subunit I
MPQLGQGILKGMGITLKHLFDNKVTRQYPEYKKQTFERSRGLLTVDMDRCIACLQCMRICPDHCISIEQEKRDADGQARRSPTRSGS